MRYERYIELNRERWDAFEVRLAQLEQSPKTVSHGDLEELSVAYRKVLHDHAVVNSRFKNTWASDHLRHLAVRANHLLQWQSKGRRKGLLYFLLVAFPRNFRSIAGEIVVSGCLLIASAIFGAALSALDPAVGTAFIGQQSAEGLREGEIWTDAIREDGASSSARIAANNMRVAVTAWGGGMLAGLGAFYILFLNGFLLGAVVLVTYHFQMNGALLNFISAHGPLELSLIVIAAAAGVHVGRTLVSPGVVPLSERLPESAQRSSVVMLGCLPWLLVLGFVEGFISPSPDISQAVKLALGILILSLFLISVLLPGRNDKTEEGAAQHG